MEQDVETVVHEIKILLKASPRTHTERLRTYFHRPNTDRFLAKHMADGVSKPCLPCLETLSVILKRKCDRHSCDRQETRSLSCSHTSSYMKDTCLQDKHTRLCCSHVLLQEGNDHGRAVAFFACPHASAE